MGNHGVLHPAEIRHTDDVAELVDIPWPHRDTHFDWLGCASRRPLR
jgi:hypothetical protein